ncbi:MAG TPA: hypothetical protein VL225_06870 [Vicinamibacterales bacterium]|nr:hypothetical protein [Vicinamibacterales bacterium]
MNYRALGSVVAAAAIAFAKPVMFVAQEAGRAAEVLSASRRAIGDRKLDSLKTFSVQSQVQRNVGGMQMNADVEIVLDLPDAYLRTESMNGAGGMMIRGGGTTGFSGDRPLQKADAGGAPGGGMVIRMMGPGGSFSNAPTEKPTPEQQEEMNRAIVRASRAEASRLMLGWFAMAHPALNAQYTYAGEAESPDGKAFVIDVRNADNFAARLFIDEQTHLPLMVTYKAAQPRMVQMTAGGSAASSSTTHTSGDQRKAAEAEAAKQMQELQRQAPVMADFTIYFEDWRDVEGVKFPFKMRRAVAGDTTEEWTVGKVKVNPKVDPKRFSGDG